MVVLYTKIYGTSLLGESSKRYSLISPSIHASHYDVSVLQQDLRYIAAIGQSSKKHSAEHGTSTRGKGELIYEKYVTVGPPSQGISEGP
jgi:hypothetical protein